MTLHPELLAALLADVRLPVAGHTQSSGLEPALVAGTVTAATIPSFLTLRLRTVVRTEAATAVLARASVLAGESWGEESLAAVQEVWAARTPSAAMRRTSRTLGRALLRLAPRLVPQVRLLEFPPEPPRPVVLGVLCGLGGVDAATTARLVAYDDVQTVVAAALKLLPLDPAEATTWVVNAFDDIDAAVAAVADVTSPEQVPSRNAPVLEEHAERHAHTTRRLFSA
ncbi:urease accessory protein UreF [Nocardioides yefusunii]|uniref:Urease accessory protein UreF n=1 Tax=Nocardioides yefusunii TaxID=2500546 RepID=A0ABW1R1E5_9ACTN|nr:urease accessory UreF family protein [Nocardioides yefusunii]